MNLTKLHKQAIVRAVLADIPRKNMEELETTVKQMVDEDIEKHAPKEIWAVWKDKSLACYLSVLSMNVGYLRTDDKSRYLDGFFQVIFPERHEFSRQFKSRLTPMLEKLVAETKAMQEVKDKLESALAGVRTRKQFMEMFPELEKYAPPEPRKDALLPATASVVEDLSRLGLHLKQEIANT